MSHAFPGMVRIMWKIVLNPQPRQSFRIKSVRLRFEQLGHIEYAYHIIDFTWKTVILVSDSRSASIAKMPTNARRRFIHRGLTTDEFNLIQQITNPDY